MVPNWSATLNMRYGNTKKFTDDAYPYYDNCHVGLVGNDAVIDYIVDIMRGD